MNFIALDFETANKHRSSICSIGLALVENGKVTGSDHILVRPTPDYYDPINSMLHGITDRHTRTAKTFQQLWYGLWKYFHQQTIVAHNASFDCSALRGTLDAYNLKYPDLDYYCTYRLSQKALNLNGYKLDEVSRHFNIKLKHHHAESDALACAMIAIKLCETHQVKSLEELAKKYNFNTGKIISFTKSYRAFSKK